MIFQNKLRMGNGEVDFYLADTLRKHITYTYHYFSINKMPVYMRYEDYKELGNWLIDVKSKYAPHTSLRILDRALQIAASAALVKAPARGGTAIEINDAEIALAKQFIEQELISRAQKSS